MATDSPSYVHVRAGGVRWQVLRECRAALLGPRGLALDDWLHDGRAELIRHRPHQSVFHVTLGGLDFYLKRYRPSTVWAWFREFFRPSKARLEYERTRAVAACRLPTAVPLGVGEEWTARGPGDSFLITRSLPDTQTLDRLVSQGLPELDSVRRARVGRRLAEGLGRFVARLHDAGIAHDDLHAGNLLIRLGADDRPELYLIDLYSVRIGKPLSWRASRANLVLFNHWAQLRTSRADRLRFWRAYCAQRQTAAPFFRACATDVRLIADLEARTWVSNLRNWRRRDRRCQAANRDFTPVRHGACRGHARADFPRGVLTELMADPDVPFRRPEAAVGEDTTGATTVEFDLVLGDRSRRVIYTRFRARSSRALHGWVTGNGLTERGLFGPRPLAVFLRRRGLLRREGYLLAEKGPESLTLPEHLREARGLSSGEQREAVRRAARFVRELHRRQLAPEDLRASDVRLARHGGAWLQDVWALAGYRKLSRAHRVRNLAQLLATLPPDQRLGRTDGLRFLRVYLRGGVPDRGGWKAWWREVVRAAGPGI
jgi:hypothetical protein